MRMEGPVVALVLIAFVVVVALLVATTSRRGQLEIFTTEGAAPTEVVRDNVYHLATCDPTVVNETLRGLARTYRILSMTSPSQPCNELWIVVETR
jgi:hypothetical protein